MKRSHQGFSAIEALLIVLLVGLLGLAGWFVWSRNSDGNTSTSAAKATWLQTPKRLSDLQLLSGSYNDADSFEYYQIGTTGEGYQIIAAWTGSSNGIRTYIGHLVNKSGEYLFVTDNRYYDTSTYSNKLRFDRKVMVDPNFNAVPALGLEKEISLPGKKVSLVSSRFENSYWFPKNDFHGPAKEAAHVGAVSSGKLYLTKRPCYIDGNTISGCNVELYTLYRHDFRLAYYALKPGLNFSGDVPAITWSGGTPNTTKYFQPNFAESHDVIVDVADPSKELEVVGTADNGKNIYQFKSAENSLETAYYTAETSSIAPAYTSKQQYHNDKNLILFQDDLGRFNVLVTERLNNYYR